jgi:hypothetical protein
MLIDPCELSPSYVRSIAAYQPGKPISELAREMGLDERSIVKLASNENPRGIGPRTRAAIDAALADIARYPDGNGFELKSALSARYGGVSRSGPRRRHVAACLRRLSARDAGARRAFDRGAGEELCARPRDHGARGR